MFLFCFLFCFVLFFLAVFSLKENNNVQSLDVRSETAGIKKHCYGGKRHFDKFFIQIVKKV